MTYDDDQLGELADTPLVRALRAPGTPSELAGEEQVLAAFRAQHAGRRRRGPGRVVGRIGAGGTALVTVIALTGGVAAAAYNQVLPDRFQAFAHEALGGLGVPPARDPQPPAAQHDPADRGDRGDAPRGPRTADPSATRAPGRTPSAGPDRPRPRGKAGTRRHEAPSGPAVVRVSLAERTVDAGGSTVITARVRDEVMEPVVAQEVRLWQRPVGGTWAPAGAATTDDDGWVSITTEPVTASTDLRLETTVVDVLGEAVVLQSEQRRVVVRPWLEAGVSGSALSVQVGGARAGDEVWLARRGRGGRMQAIGTLWLDEQGAASLDVERFRGQGPVRIRVRLPRTAAHLGAERWVTVRLGVAPEPTPGPEPTPTAEPSF